MITLLRELKLSDIAYIIRVFINRVNSSPETVFSIDKNFSILHTDNECHYVLISIDDEFKNQFAIFIPIEVNVGDSGKPNNNAALEERMQILARDLNYEFIELLNEIAYRKESRREKYHANRR